MVYISDQLVSVFLTQEVVVGVSLVLEGETSVADVVEVLEPLKVRHCHATSICIEILTSTTSHHKSSIQSVTLGMCGGSATKCYMGWEYHGKTFVSIPPPI